MTIQAPTVDYFDETTWPTVEIEVFKCCVVDGVYVGDTFMHNPDIPGDGPWFTVIHKDGVSVSLGFGTKEAAVAAIDNVTKYSLCHYEIDIEEIED